MDERIREMRLKLDKIAWEPEQSEKNKRAFAFIVVYSDYLIQQAEKANELEEHLKVIEDSWGYQFGVKAAEYVDVLEKENQRYKEALEFYADRENHVAPFLFMQDNGIPVHNESKVDEDKGHKARQALGGDENA